MMAVMLTQLGPTGWHWIKAHLAVIKLYRLAGHQGLTKHLVEVGK